MYIWDMGVCGDVDMWADMTWVISETWERGCGYCYMWDGRGGWDIGICWIVVWGCDNVCNGEMCIL